MTNPFKDQKYFMTAGEQTTETYNAAQTELYIKLMVEEFQEAVTAESLENYVKELCDLIVVTIGTLYSIGVDAEEVWRRVHASNLSKLVGGRVVKDENGKIQKPDSYQPARLADLIENITGLEDNDLVKTEREKTSIELPIDKIRTVNA